MTRLHLRDRNQLICLLTSLAIAQPALWHSVYQLTAVRTKHSNRKRPSSRSMLLTRCCVVFVSVFIHYAILICIYEVLLLLSVIWSLFVDLQLLQQQQRCRFISYVVVANTTVRVALQGCCACALRTIYSNVVWLTLLCSNRNRMVCDYTSEFVFFRSLFSVHTARWIRIYLSLHCLWWGNR